MLLFAVLSYAQMRKMSNCAKGLFRPSLGKIHMTKKEQTENTEKLVKLGCLVTPEVRNEFKSKAAKEGLNIKQALTRLVVEYIRNKSK